MLRGVSGVMPGHMCPSGLRGWAMSEKSPEHLCSTVPRIRTGNDARTHMLTVPRVEVISGKSLGHIVPPVPCSTTGDDARGHVPDVLRVDSISGMSPGHMCTAVRRSRAVSGI